MPDIDLDVDSPDKVSNVLRREDDAYYESAGELESTWQDPGAGRPWIKIAKILETAAAKIDKTI